MAELAFTVIVRLPDDFAPASDKWVDWQRAREVFGERAFADPQHEPPFKRYPGEQRRYFAAHVERVLFPRADARSAQRWIRRPNSVVMLGSADRAEFALTINLLECVRVGLAPHHVYGLIHMSTVDGLTPDAMVCCASALGRRFRRSGSDHPFLAIEGPDGLEPLEGNWTLRVLASALFGAAHPSAGDRSMICTIAPMPDALTGKAADVWRRALGQGDSLDEARAKLARDPKRDELRRVELRDVTGLVFGRAAVFTHDDGDPGSYLFNVRSYWCEVILFAHIQHSYLEVYAIRLAELGADPPSTDVAGLFENWLAFRNTLWWSHLSPATDVPQKLLPRARAQLGTQALFDELEQSFATYVAERQRRSDDRLANALAALQVYGAMFAAVGTIAAVLKVIGDGLFDGWQARVAVVAGLSVIAVAVYHFIRRRVDRP